jgi:hypothetical protein
VVLFFGAAFWNYRSAGKNLGSAAIAAVWLLAAAYICAANISRIEGAFAAAWAPVKDAQVREEERVRQIDVSLNNARLALDDAQKTAIHDPKRSVRDNAQKIGDGLRIRISDLEKDRESAPPKVQAPPVKHFLIGMEAAAPICLLITAQVALWATFGAGTGGGNSPPSSRFRQPADEPAETGGENRQKPANDDPAKNRQNRQNRQALKSNDKKPAKNRQNEKPATILPFRQPDTKPDKSELAGIISAMRQGGSKWADIAAAAGVSERECRRIFQAKEAVKHDQKIEHL